MAIAIISVCLFIATLIYIRVLDSEHDVSYYRAKQEISMLYFKAVKEQDFEDNTYDYEAFKITKEVVDYNSETKQIQFEVEDHSVKQKYTYLVNPVVRE